MFKNIYNARNWYNETEEDSPYDSDATDDHSDYVCTNTRNVIDYRPDTDVIVYTSSSITK